MSILAPRAIDLSNPVALHEAVEADRQHAEIVAGALAQIGRLNQRISYLERKHARLPIGNAKRKTAKAISDAQALRQRLGAVV